MDIATRAPIAGPTFIRLLARIANLDGRPSGLAPSQRLGQWIDWPRAITLSRALDRPLDAPAMAPRGHDPADEVMQARRALEMQVGDREAWDRAMQQAAADAGFVEPRKRYVAIQHAMQAASGRLRGSLRDRLARGAPAQARLAELDAVMELVASPREHRLLAAVPGLLAERHLHLHRQASAGRDAPDLPAQATPTAEAWPHVLRQDMQALLLAELDVRFMPIEGLLAALRAH
ncbi:MAG TPA: DUF3348 family protein [Thermomonas sp.]|nr:DUF3348 family protein [Thermomonas sp.]